MKTATAPSLDRAAVTESDTQRATLHPTVALAVGPTALAALHRACVRERQHLGAVPPFHAFVGLGSDGNNPIAELWIGEQTVQPEWPGGSQPTPNEWAGAWTQAALRRVTDIGCNLDHGIWRDCRNVFERVEFVVVAALEEVEHFEWIEQAAAAVVQLVPACRRFALFWTAPLSETSPQEQERRSRLVSAHLAALERRQQPLFEAAFLLDHPATDGLVTIQSTDAVELTGAFLGYALGSSFGRPLREFIHPATDRSRFCLGFVQRYYDSGELTQALQRFWLREAIALLDAPLQEESPPVTDAGAISPGKLRDETLERAEQAIQEFLAAVRHEASGGRTNAEWRIDGLFAHAQSHLRRQQENILRLFNAWERERDEQEHRWEHWKLLNPNPTLHGMEETEKEQKNWALLLLFVLPLLPIAHPIIEEAPIETLHYLIAGCLFVIILVLHLLFFRKRVRITRHSSRENPEYTHHNAEGKKIQQRLKLARYMTMDPERSPDATFTKSDPPPAGAWRAASELGHQYHELILLREALHDENSSCTERDGWFIRNIVSSDDLKFIFEQILVERFGKPPTAAMRASVQSALGDKGLLGLLSGGHQDVLLRLKHFGQELFAGCAALGLRELLNLVGHNHGGGGDGVSVFFNALANGAVILGRLEPHSLLAESVYLIYNDPWDAGTIRRGQEIIGRSDSVRAAGYGEVALVRLARLN